MATFLNLTTVLIFMTYLNSFTFCQFYLDPVHQYSQRKSASGRFHKYRKASDIQNVYATEFLKEIEARFSGPPSLTGLESKEPPHQWIAAVNTKEQRVAEKQIKSTEVEDKNSSLSQEVAVTKDPLRHGRSKKSTENCNQKCFVPKCEVECLGDQASAACSAKECRALTRGEDSASLCSGDSCHALCFNEECISGCEGSVCFVKCHGKRCHAVAEGDRAGSSCVNEECMAYGNGNGTHIKCDGESCQAQCMGPNCVAECNGLNCVAGCSGKDCRSKCVGHHCQQLEHVGDPGNSVNIGKESFEDIQNHKNAMPDEEGSNNNFIDKKVLTYDDVGKTYKELLEPPKVVVKNDHHHEEGDSSDSSDKVKLNYSVNVRLAPSLVLYIRDKIYQLQKMASYMQYLKMGR